MADALLQRRGFLRGLTALPLIGGAADVPPALAEPDPIIRLHDEWKDLVTFIEGPSSSVAEANAAFDRRTAIEEQMPSIRPTTVAGAIRALEWVGAEFREHHDEGVAGDVLIVALLDGTLGVLRKLSAAGVPIGGVL